jgi:hypothetical protein
MLIGLLDIGFPTGKGGEKRTFHPRVTESTINYPKIILKDFNGGVINRKGRWEKMVNIKELDQESMIIIFDIDKKLKEHDFVINRLADKKTLTFAKDLLILQWFLPFSRKCAVFNYYAI